MNIHTYLEKRANKMPLNQRVVDFINERIITPSFTQAAVAGAAAGEAAVRAIGTPIKALHIYTKEGKKRAIDLISQSEKGEKLINSSLVAGTYGGDIAARAGMGYGAYKGGKKIKKYIQDKKRGQ